MSDNSSIMSIADFNITEMSADTISALSTHQKIITAEQTAANAMISLCENLKLMRDKHLYEALGFERLDEMSTLVSACLDDPYAIGYSIMTYLNDVYSNEALLAFSLNGYSATPENVRTGDYPLGTKGYVVIRSDETEDSPARRLYNWFGSPLSDTFLTSCGITPLSK